MALVVGALPYSQWRRLTPLLDALGWDGRSSDPESFYRAQSQASATKDVRYLLIHARPERCIAQALLEGMDLKTAVSEWETSADALLEFFKRNRSHSVLLDVDAVCEDPQSVLDWLSQNQPQLRESVELAHSKSVKLGNVVDGQLLEANLHLLIATQAVKQSSGIRALLPYYEAGTVPIGQGTYAEPLVDLMSMYEKVKDVKNGRDLKEENDLVIKELFKVQEELERYYLTNKELQEKLDYSTSEMEKFSQDKQKEIAGIRRTLSDKERELSKRSKRLRALERERNELNSALIAIQSSLFWRLTFPLRWLLSKVKRVGRLFRRRGIKRDVRFVQNSELFDAQWYTTQYPDVVNSGLKPEEHYVRHGAFEGRDPSPYFSSKNYLRANPDVAKAGLNPLVHYVRHGKDEGRRVA